MKGVRCALARGVQSPQPDPDLDVGSLPVATGAHAHDSPRLVVPLRGFDGSLFSLAQTRRNVEETDPHRLSEAVT